MRAFASLVGLVSSLALACAASGPQPLKLAKKPFLDTGLYRVERPGRGELFVAPDLERVRAQIRGAQGAIVSCHVTPTKDAPELAAAKLVLERQLCAAVERGITSRPIPQGGQAPARVTTSPGPGVLLVSALLINVEGDATSLAPTSKSILSLRFSESQSRKPVMRYYEPLLSAADDPLDGFVDSSVGRLYGIYDHVLLSGDTDVAAPPR